MPESMFFFLSIWGSLKCTFVWNFVMSECFIKINKLKKCCIPMYSCNKKLSIEFEYIVSSGCCWRRRDGCCCYVIVSIAISGEREVPDQLIS